MPRSRGPAIRNRLALVAALSGGSVLANERGAVSFSGPENECPPPSYVGERVARLVGPTERNYGTANVLVKKSENGYDTVVSVQTRDGRGERRFSIASCQLAADAAALIVAISIFPERAGELTARATDAETAAAPPPPSSERVPSLIGFSAAAGGKVETSLPFVAVGAGLGFDVRLGEHFVVDLSAAAFLPQRVHQTETASAEFALQTGALQGCYELQSTRTEAGPCLGAKVIRLVGEGAGTDRTYDGAEVYLGPSVGAMLRWKLSSSLGLRMAADLFFPLKRRPFLLNGLEIHRPPQMVPSGFMGLDVSF